MKKTIKFLNILMLCLLLVSCEKDKGGIPVKYYENVTGEGYTFVKYSEGHTDHGLIFPNKAPIHIRASEKAREFFGNNDPDNYSYSEWIKVDDNGKFTCRFLEKRRPSVWAWGWKYMTYYEIFGSERQTYTSETIREAAKIATKKNPQVIHIDTIWQIY